MSPIFAAYSSTNIASRCTVGLAPENDKKIDILVPIIGNIPPDIGNNVTGTYISMTMTMG
jgi:hypothetical protein